MKKTVIFAILFCIVSCLNAFSQIVPGITDEDREEFARHRNALYEKLGDNIVLLIGAYKPTMSMRFRQSNRFYYLTGVEEPYAALIMDGNNDQTILFLRPVDKTEEQWEGKMIGPGSEAVRTFGIQDVRSVDELEQVINSKIGPGGTLYLSFWPEVTICTDWDGVFAVFGESSRYPWARDPGYENNLLPKQYNIVNWLRGLIPTIQLLDISREIDDLRRVKSSWEIVRLREVVRISGLAVVAAMKATRPGKMEYDLSAEVKKVFIENGAFLEGEEPIIASGKNSAVFHYMRSMGKLKKKDMVMADIGPDYRYYSADLTRTWPVSGKFKNKKYTKIYSDLLEIHKALIKKIKPGIYFSDINGWFKNMAFSKGYDESNVVNCVHYVGMSIHDEGDTNKPLEPGVTFSLEPHLYFNNFGVRVQDTILVTKDGCEVLSANIPIEIEDIEKTISQ